MKKIIFTLTLVFISSCSDNRVLTYKKCETREQALKCMEGCKNDGDRLSRFNFNAEKEKIMYLVTQGNGHKYIFDHQGCKIIDKNNWQCKSGGFMFDGVFTLVALKECAVAK